MHTCTLHMQARPIHSAGGTRGHGQCIQPVPLVVCGGGGLVKLACVGTKTNPSVGSEGREGRPVAGQTGGQTDRLGDG